MTETAPDLGAGDTASISEDLLLDGRVRLRQPRIGYRAGLDAALLAAACDAASGEQVLDLGCGAGAVMLAAATRRTGARFTGIERDEAALALAHGNIALNGLGDRASAIVGDVGQGFAALELDPFDSALCNPPFFDDPAALRAPHPARKDAYMAQDGLQAWIAFLLKAVRQGGAVTLVHRADRLGDILGLLSGKAGSVRIRPVHPFADQPAGRVLVRAVKSGKAPLVLLPPLVLHDHSGAKHTPEAEALLRGERGLTWDR